MDEQQHDERQTLGEALGVSLRWRAAVVPPEVETGRADDQASGTADDDPAADAVPSADPAWDAALAVLAVDPEFLRRRALVDDVGLHVVVRESDEATLAAYPEDGPTEDVVLVVPVADHLDEGGAPLPLEERVQAHLDAVVTVLVETQSALGRE